MPSSRYDAIIVGARISGCGMAAFLSRAGFHVLMVDRVHFPKPALSCPLYFANTLTMLKRLGALPRIQAIGAPEIRLYQVRTADVSLRGRMLPYHGIDYAYSIQREVFDAAFFEYVAGLPNVETRLGFNVTGLVWNDAHTRVLGVTGSLGGAAEEELRAELVVGADGVFSTVAKAVGATRYAVKPPRSCVYYAYYSNVKRESNEPTATFYQHAIPPFVFITSDSDHDMTVISLSLPAARLNEVRHEPDRVHALFAQHIPGLADRMSGAARETPMMGVSPRESFYRVPFGPGWVLVGDAGYYKDPITGQGIHDGLRSAELAAAAYAEYRQGADWTHVMQRYQAARDHETRGLYDLTDYYAQVDRTISKQEMDLFRAMSEMPHWANRYVSLFNGVTDARAFARTPNLVRITLEWQARRLWQRLTGQTVLHSIKASA